MKGYIADKLTDTNFHLSILQDVSEIINFAENFQEVLDKIVKLIAKRLQMNVCSVYLMDEQTNTLLLQATEGLNKNSVGAVRLKVGEGVSSLAIEKRRPISIYNVKNHPRYIHFPETEEANFNSFLAVPIFNKKNVIGVLAVQKKNKYYFHINEINMLQILAVQVASVIQVSQIFERSLIPPEKQITKESIEQPLSYSIPKSYRTTTKEPNKKKLLTLQGIPTSFGYGYGKVRILNDRFNYSIITDQKIVEVEKELSSFHKAIKKSKEEIYNISKSLKGQVPKDITKIFDSHIMILEDKQLISQVEALIKNKNNAAYSTLQVLDKYLQSFSQIKDPFLRERVVDIEDIGKRIISNLLGLSPVDLNTLSEQCIIVASVLTSSTTANLDTSKVIGIITEHGGSTSHASILARSLEIPAVIGVKNLLNKVQVEDYLMVDGNTGFVFINPHKSLINEYEKAELKIQEYHSYFQQFISNPLSTRDDIPISVSTNIGMLSDIELAKQYGVKSVGLFRTEFPYMIRDRLPTGDEQYKIYKQVIDSFPEGEVTIRTLDIGGDKFLHYLAMPKEDNPVLGYKSTRFLLDHSYILLEQLKAIIRASINSKVKILFPMISSINELMQVKDYLEVAKGLLLYKEIDFNPNIEIGIMIEVPSIIFQLEDLLPHVDFMSIGTNDLIQYLLAVDRDNEKVSNIYSHFNPAFIKALHTIRIKTAKHNKPISVCGEMSASPRGALALMALGFYDLSCAPSSIPYIHYLVRNINKKVLDEVRGNILTQIDTFEIQNYLNKVIGDFAPKLMS